MQRNLLMDVGIVPRVHSREGIDAALRMEYAASVSTITEIPHSRSLNFPTP
jgi:hypothetical protein